MSKKNINTNNMYGGNMLWYILLFFLLVIILLLFVPVKIKFTFEYEKKDIDTKLIKGKNRIEVFLFYCIKIIDFDLNLKNKKNKNDKIKKKKLKIKIEYVRALFSKVYVQSLDLKLDYNLQDVFLNTFSMAIINAIIGVLLANKSDKMNFKNIKYSTNISDNLIFLDVKSIIKFSLANTIRVIIKIMIDMRKVEKENGRTASNRKFNDDSYDIA